MTIGVSVASHKLYFAFSFSFPYSTLPSRATSQSERVCFLKDFGSFERLLRVSNFPRGAYRVSLCWPEECLKPWPRMSKRTFRNRSGSKKYEIEYLIARNNKTCPIEVRSGSSLRHTSSDESCEKILGWDCRQSHFQHKGLQAGRGNPLPSCLHDVVSLNERNQSSRRDWS